LVEDERDIRFVARFQLEAGGHTVVEARDGIEAIELLDSIDPDVVLLDLHMPRMSGLDFLEHLRRNGPTGLPVVIFSGDDGSETLQKVSELGYERRVEKPYKASDLLDAVSTT
jgi:two-component system, chemotaxis family, chemotaxis protein CheY